MTKLLLFFACISVASFADAQQTDFEGKLQYRTQVTSRNPKLSAAMLQRLLLADDTVTIYVKEGNYLRLTANYREYYVRKDEKVYIHFNGIDTLYFRNYSDDTSTIKNAYKETGNRKIAGYDCSVFTIVTSSDTARYHYAPQLYANPVYTQKLSLGHLNVFGEQTQAVWLESESRTENYVLTNACYNVSREKVDEKLFTLPKLPVEKFTYASIFKAPVYAGNGSWAVYLQKNMNTGLLVKHLKIKKGQSSAEQKAEVSFDVLKDGQIVNVRVLNKDKVHSALAKEAVRLVQNATWQPAILLNQTMDFTLTQPIVFRIESE